MAYSSGHTVSHATESSEPQSTLVHSRNLSTVSSVTLHTNTTLHSQPYEPLLRPITPTSGEYFDVGSQPSKDSDQNLALPRWSQIVSRDPSVLKEKKSYTHPAKPLTRPLVRQWSKRILQTLLALWSIYSTIRYLLAFTIYQSITGQVVSLVLGAAAGLSFAFAACGSILTMFQTTLLMNGISVNAILSIRSTLYYIASCCLLGPSIVNLVLLVVWRKSSDIELQTRHRCKLDVDLIWSTTYSLCNRRSWSWASWAALSAFRLVATLTIIIAFHLIASSSQFTPVRRTANPHYAKSKKSHNRMESCETPLIPGRSQSSVVMPYLTQDPTLQRQGSDLTLSSKSSPRNRLHNSRSRASPVSDENLEHTPTDTPIASTSTNPFETDRIDNGFIDRFRTLISQYTRETEEGLRFARSDDASSHQTSGSSSRKDSPDMTIEDGHRDYHYTGGNDDEDGDDFYANAAAHTVQPYDYEQNYPADEHVRMMNAYVRRMPTIESMGSREMQSTIGAASWAERDRGASSRPPTRNTLAGSWAGSSEFLGSEPRSRPTSMSAQAELLAGMFGRANASELGELMRRGDSVRMVGDAGHEQSANDDSSEALGEQGNGYASTTTGSKGSKESKESTTNTYHTASTGSMRSTASSMSLTTALADATGTPLPLMSQSSPLRHTVINESSES